MSKPRTIPPEVRDAMSRMLRDGLWGDPARLDAFRAFMSATWAEFKDDPDYQQYVQALKDAWQNGKRHE